MTEEIQRADDLLQAIRFDGEKKEPVMSNGAVDQAIQEAIAWALLDIAKSLDAMASG